MILAPPYTDKYINADIVSFQMKMIREKTRIILLRRFFIGNKFRQLLS